MYENKSQSEKLKPENYILGIIENKIKLDDYLSGSNWVFNMDQGSLVFYNKAGELVAECPIQIIGTEGYKANTWMWAWANHGSNIPEKLLHGVNKVNEEAKFSDDRMFLDPEISLSENLAKRLSIISADFLGHFTYFSCPYDGGCMYVTIEKSPIKQEAPRSLPSMITTIQTGISSSLEFNHKDAVISYLGNNPVNLGNNKLKWDFEVGSIVIEFDEKGKIINLSSSMKGEKK